MVRKVKLLSLFRAVPLPRADGLAATFEAMVLNWLKDNPDAIVDEILYSHRVGECLTPLREIGAPGPNRELGPLWPHFFSALINYRIQEPDPNF